MPIKVTGTEGAYSRTEWIDGSQGYVINVYENAVVLRGRDFTNSCDIPLGTYLLDTTLKTVAEGTYTDSTGTITT